VTGSIGSKTCDAGHIFTKTGQYTIKVAVTNSHDDTSVAMVTILVKKIGK
jgi:hypothetical protein